MNGKKIAEEMRKWFEGVMALPEEERKKKCKELLVGSGIFTEDGELTEPYQSDQYEVSKGFFVDNEDNIQEEDYSVSVDGTQAELLIDIIQDSNLYVAIRSCDFNKKHDKLKTLIGKKVRITIEEK